MSPQDHVVAFRTVSLPEAEMVLELLRGEGLAARLVRPQGVLAGAALNLYETRIEVPAESGPRATELLADLEVAGASEEMDRALDAGAPQPPRPRLRIIAAGVGLICPSGCHLYARRPWTALILALGFLMALLERGGAAVAGDALLAQFSFLLMAAVVASDLAGGLWALGATNRGLTAPRARQVGLGFGLLAAAMGLAAGATAVADAPRRARARLLARFSVTCAASAIRIENDSDDTRFVALESVTVSPIPRSSAAEAIGLPGQSQRLTLEAHGHGEVSFHVGGPLRAACAGEAGAAFPGAGPGAPPIGGCGLWLRFTIEPTTALDLQRIDATALCRPGWGDATWSEPATLQQTK